MRVAFAVVTGVCVGLITYGLSNNPLFSLGVGFAGAIVTILIFN